MRKHKFTNKQIIESIKTTKQNKYKTHNTTPNKLKSKKKKVRLELPLKKGLFNVCSLMYLQCLRGSINWSHSFFILVGTLPMVFILKQEISSWSPNY